MAKVNKLQKDFADFRAQHIRERALVNFNTNRPQVRSFTASFIKQE